MTTKNYDVEGVPKIPGWVTMQEVALALGVSRTIVYRRAERREFHSLHYAGVEGTRPIYFIKDEELQELIAGESPA